MKHTCIFQTLRRVQSFVADRGQWLLALAITTSTLPVHAQVFAVAPSTFSMSVATGGSAMATVTPVARGDTGDRLPDATLCGALSAGGQPGVGLANPCSAATAFGTVNVGAAASSLVSQTFGVSYTPAQLSAIVSTLTVLGQPFGRRQFFIVTQFQSRASPAAAPIAPRFVTLQINLIESPPSGIIGATTSLVDVAQAAPSTVQIRYSLAGADTPVAGQFCTALSVAYPSGGVTSVNPCLPGSSLGFANAAVGFGAGLQTGETLSIPESIARQASQRAAASGSGVFYFIRQFSSGKYAVVQLRLSGNAANAPLALTEVRLGFREGGSLQNIGFFKRGQVLPAVSAFLRYQGAGVLRARWELVRPNDPPPTTLDLTAEASLSPLERAQQHRYQVLERVNVYLPAMGQAVLAGPNPKLLLNEDYGQYQLLLRIEASDSLAGLPAGAAPFVLPVLRYYIGEGNAPMVSAKSAPEPITLLAPQAGAVLKKDAAVSFQWLENKGVSQYRLEIEANGKRVYSARVAPRAQDGVNRYTAPPFIAATLVNTVARWRVIALAADGRFIGESGWREIANTP